MKIIALDTTTTFKETPEKTCETVEALFPKTDILTDSQEHVERQSLSIKENLPPEGMQTAKTPEVRLILAVIKNVSIMNNCI